MDLKLKKSGDFSPQFPLFSLSKNVEGYSINSGKAIPDLTIIMLNRLKVNTPKGGYMINRFFILALIVYLFNSGINLNKNNKLENNCTPVNVVYNK